jgi:hypothetical protein
MLRTDGQWYSVVDLLLEFNLISRANQGKPILEAIKEVRPDIFKKIEIKVMGGSKTAMPMAEIKVCTEILLAASVPLQEIESFFRDHPYYITLDALSKGFYDYEPCLNFYCHTKIIDLYLAQPRIAIILDDDTETESAIKSALACSIIRCNPIADNFSLGAMIAEIRQLISSNTASKIIDMSS